MPTFWGGTSKTANNDYKAGMVSFCQNFGCNLSNPFRGQPPPHFLTEKISHLYMSMHHILPKHTDLCRWREKTRRIQLKKGTTIQLFVFRITFLDVRCHTGAVEHNLLRSQPL